MSHGGAETQGTGLRDVFNILAEAPQQRLQSLTFQLGDSPEDSIIHALCLIVLKREPQALDKLQTLQDNHLASHLVQKWQQSGGKLEDFSVHCGNFQELGGESLATLARIFKVLSEQRLCDERLRNLAYQKAVSCDGQKTNNPADLEYDELREEAKAVCGPQFAEWMLSPISDRSDSDCDPLQSQSEGITTFNVSQDQSQRCQNFPNTLQACSSVASYPSTLEISMPPTTSFKEDITPQSSHVSKLTNTAMPLSESKVENAPQTTVGPLRSVEPLLSGAMKHPAEAETSCAENRTLDSPTNQTRNQLNKPTTEPKCEPPAAQNIFLPKTPVAKEINRSASVEEEEETFYAFVILHAPEDEDMAESMREKVEKVTGGEGAIFSTDFAIPGKSTLRSVEDAINNSAFTLLLLTRNFNNPMQEVEADSALINSINKKHKYNTVIPLMPQENCMSKEEIPLVLSTKNRLEENRHFERKIQKAMSPAIIKKQRKIWSEEKALKLQKKKQEELRQSNQLQKEVLRESQALQVLTKENLCLLMAQQRLGHNLPPGQEGGDGNAPWLKNRSIHIEKANYIMIGNDSRMTVGLPEGAAQDDSIFREEEDDDQ